MTRQIHDQFAKEYLEELLASLGTIKKSKKVKSEVQEIDVWFEPDTWLSLFCSTQVAYFSSYPIMGLL